MTDPARRRVLLVDDETAITATLAPFLERSGFTVRVASDGAAALAAHAAQRPDIVVTDVLMPVMDGRELVRRLRAAEEWTPIILLTQVDESFERTAALEEGADDYLGKPFDPPELVARIRAVLRRSAGAARPLAAAASLRGGAIALSRLGRTVTADGRAIELTPKAFALLEHLMLHAQEALSRETLLEAVWGFEFAIPSRAVDHRIAEIRRAIGEDPGAPRHVETVQGHGYRFLPPVEGI
ncbi:response regulator transcription factor [Brachybacterium hainanense]|uniref:Response regulator transcription factor n=1 Tax=Brachybacterium hainanense TaxID=1541174 RepID=A0ABV6RAI2_9MICO